MREVPRLVDLCRAALGRAICESHKNLDGTLAAVTLSPRLENMLGDTLGSADAGAALEPDLGRALLNELNNQVEKAVAAGKQPVILTSGRIRSALHRMIEPMLPHVAVLSFSEIATGTPVTSVGTVRLNDE